MSYEAPEEYEYKGYPMLKIYTGKEYDGKKETISVGVRKAKAICDQIDYIRKFVDKHEKGGGDVPY